VEAIHQHCGGGRHLIPKAYIKEWRQYAPWPDDRQVEQDLVVCRALVDIFSDDVLAQKLAFRGGTALFKLYLNNERYSEDIDLVQVGPESIGPILNALQDKLKWFGKSPRRDLTSEGATLKYRFTSEDDSPMRLKLEINTREHNSFNGFVQQSFSVDSKWFKGSASIQTYSLEELLGTKVRALYQRKKGRDLFDLWVALSKTSVLPEKVIDCFLKYMNAEKHTILRDEFERNLREKLVEQAFRQDITPLLPLGNTFDPDTAAKIVTSQLLTLIPTQISMKKDDEPPSGGWGL
jgi:predicted nucleotidyltransferase component of viral defense system